jgi:hypothetical protein
MLFVGDGGREGGDGFCGDRKFKRTGLNPNDSSWSSDSLL